MSKNYKVYVLNQNGQPLMPTTRFGKVRRMLKSGEAKAVSTKPFVIQLCYEPKTHVVQEIVLGIDPGRTNIGISVVAKDGKNLYSSKCTTSNKSVPRHMKKRKQCRQASRRGERKRRQRRAKRNGTVFKESEKRERILPGCEKSIINKLITNSEARFNNRKRPAGWHTPTATQLLRTHENLVNLVCKILPITDVVLEVNKFAFMAMDNPNIQRWEYQNGPLKDKGSVENAVYEMQEGKCLLCKQEIKCYHHVIPSSKGGSDTLPNIVGLCEKHHTLVHTDEKTAVKVAKKKEGQTKKYGALSVLNQIVPTLTDSLGKRFPGHFFVTNGRSTYQFRQNYKIQKDHNTDAYCIACSVLENQAFIDPPQNNFEIYQFRRHDRAIVKKQSQRSYSLDGKTVAVNRRKACSADPITGKEKKQPTDSLEDWFNKKVGEVGEKEAMRLRSKMSVKPSKRTYNNMDRHLPGSIFVFKGRRYVLRANHGNCVNAINDETEYPRGKVAFVAESAGLVYI